VKTIVRLVTVSTIAVLCMAAVGSAHTETKIRFSLDWIPGSVHSPFFIALYKGYYQAEGLDVVIDRGKGSVGLVQQMASGVYDMGFPDISVVEDFDSKNPDKAFPVLMMGYEQAPAGIAFLKASGMKAPKDLEGKSLGAAATDGGFKLFPIFMQHTNIELRRSLSSTSIPSCARPCSPNTKSTPLSDRSSTLCWNSRRKAWTPIRSARSSIATTALIFTATASPLLRRSSKTIRMQ